jgi:3-methylcrotonyl-CoA carboxylase alpha subunit
MIHKILIANRGEIAVRIIRTAREMGITTVSVYADDDSHSLHVKNADESVNLGNGSIHDTYLNISKLLEIALEYNCDAVHPGYGFLSENSDFAEACVNKNLIFIGPTTQALKLMGNKTEARKVALKLGVPIISGFEGTVDELLLNNELTFPVLIKPVAGGGGKAMEVVRTHSELPEKLEKSARLAGAIFGNNRLYIEQFIEKARHIEVQILGDNFGNVIHLFERECSIQRNFQKIIEEAPSVSLTPELRNNILSDAIKIAKSVSYTSAGTVEFLVDESGNWYFIEMNTRIQVEHPVTEAITGVDIVRQQIVIASGLPIALLQNDIHINGHAIELRINSENHQNNFIPSAGDVTLFLKPEQCRFDTFLDRKTTIGTNYDSMLAKQIVHAENRATAIYESTNQLNKVHIHGVSNNIQFLKSLLNSNKYVENKIHTRFCNEFLTTFLNAKVQSEPPELWILAYMYINFIRKNNQLNQVWGEIGMWKLIYPINIPFNNKFYEVEFQKDAESINFVINKTSYVVKFNELDSNCISLNLNNRRKEIFYSHTINGNTLLECNGELHEIQSLEALFSANFPSYKNTAPINSTKLVKSPLHGKVMKISLENKQKVNIGDVLLVIEAMKTENSIISPSAGIIKNIYVSEGMQVSDGAILVEFE